ncbi:MAG: tetratricopeptide repeat protein [Gemmatimonadota bacterium]
MEAFETSLESMRVGDSDAARAHLEALPGSDITREVDPTLLLSSLRRQAGELEAAAALVRAALEVVDVRNAHRLWLDLAVTHLWSGDLDGAENGYRRALRGEPDFLPAQLGLARILRWTGRVGEATRLYADALAGPDGEDNAEVWSGLGHLALADLDASAAREHFSRALAIDADNEEAKTGLDRLHEAKRWEASWFVVRSSQDEAPGLRGRIAIRYRLTVRRVVYGSLHWSPRPAQSWAGEPGGLTDAPHDGTASVGVSEQVTSRLNLGAGVTRIRSGSGQATQATVEGGWWANGSLVLNGGVRGGSLPLGGREVIVWGGGTRVWPTGRSAGLTIFRGTDFGDQRATSIQLVGGLGLASPIRTRASVVHTWSTRGTAVSSSIDLNVRIRPGQEIQLGLFGFRGAYTDYGVRVGGKVAM